MCLGKSLKFVYEELGWANSLSFYQFSYEPVISRYCDRTEGNIKNFRILWAGNELLKTI